MAGRTIRFWLCLVVSILLGLPLLVSDGMLAQIDPPPWKPVDAVTFVAGLYLAPCIIQAMVLGLIDGRPAVRWILGTFTIAGVLVLAIAALVLASQPQSSHKLTGVALLTAMTLLSGVAWTALLVTGTFKDTGAPPWDIQKARTTYLGRYYLPSQEAPVASRRTPRQRLLLMGVMAILIFSSMWAFAQWVTNQ